MPLAYPLKALPGLCLGEPTNRQEHSISSKNSVRERLAWQWSRGPSFVGIRARNNLEDWTAFCFRFPLGAPLRLDDWETTTKQDLRRFDQ